MKHFWNVIRLMTALLLLLAAACPALAEDDGNLLVNGGFETLNDRNLPLGWYTEAYVQQEGFTVYSVSDYARTGEHGARIHNLGLNDARFAQRVAVEPDTLYCFSGYVKVAEMAGEGRGANLSIEGLYVFSESVYEVSEDWVYLALYGWTGDDQRSVTVFARVGGYSGEDQGMATFDDLSFRAVDEVPDGYAASAWYQQTVQAPPAVEEDAEAQPFWPWLLVMSAAYAALGVWMAGRLRTDRRSLRESPRAPAFLWIGLALAAVVRLVVAWRVEGYQVDVNCFLAWGNTMAQHGPAGFYQNTSFCDYPPAYVYIMGLNALAANALHGAVPAIFVHKLVPMACDLLMAYGLYRFARGRRLSRDQAGMLGLLFAFNPAMLLNSAAWSQIDSVLCLCLAAVAWLAIEDRWAAVFPVYVLSALVKPQALMLGPLGLTAIILTIVRAAHAEPAQRKRVFRSMLIGLGVSALVALVVVVPFCFHQEKGTWLFELYGNTLASYPYATVNTANLYYLLGANWAGVGSACGWVGPAALALLAGGWGAYLFVRQKGRKLPYLEPAVMAACDVAYLVMAALHATWAVLGATAMVMAFVVTLSCLIRSGRLEDLPLCGATLFILLYVLGIKMHERYLFPALILLAMAFVLRRDRRTLILLIAGSCTLFVNEGIILDNSLRLGSSLGHLNNDTLWLNSLLSVVNVALAGLAAWTCHGVCVLGGEERLIEAKPAGSAKPEAPRSERRPAVYQPDAGLHWKRLDTLLMLAVTAVYAVVTFTTLGSTKAPQNPWKSTAYDEAVVIDLGQHYDDVRMLYFCQVSYSDFSVAVSDDGEHWSEEYPAEMRQGQCYQWKYLTSFTGRYDTSGNRTFGSEPSRLSGRYVRITADQIGLILNEAIFRDEAGNRIPATVLRAENAMTDSPNYSDPAAVLDEQDTLDGEPSWWNGTYFDEIYHARTAYEHLHGMAPYETSHPPLGKLIMAVGVAIFGMTPFGWRFAGALVGVLMLPVMYLLGKQLTKRTSIAFAAMAMMTLDCMHFTQTRIATIDSFPVLFIMLSWLFMLRFMQRDIVALPMRKVLPDLALSGFFMGCGLASKWIGAYSGMGLAVMYFWMCARHLRLHGKAAFRRVLQLCLWCLLFFVAVPLAIYLLAYVPYFAYAHIESLPEFLRRVWDANFGSYGMLAYHSQPGRGMDHPFYTPWYDWPTCRKPMYYASPKFTPEGWSYALWCFGNPAVWLVGLAGIAAVAVVWGKRHVERGQGQRWSVRLTASTWDVSPAFVLVGILAQYLPWTLVPRGTYIYHYFASVPFLILGTVLTLHWLQERKPRLGRIVLAGYLVVCLGFFVLYFPYASGLLTPTWWLDLLTTPTMRKLLYLYY